LANNCCCLGPFDRLCNDRHLQGQHYRISINANFGFQLDPSPLILFLHDLLNYVCVNELNLHSPAALVHSLMAYAVSTGLSGYMGTYDVPANRFVILIVFIFALDHVFMITRNFDRTDPNESIEVG